MSNSQEIQGLVVGGGGLARLSGIITAYTGLTLLQALLFKTNVPFSASLTLDQMGDEADFPDYVRKDVAGFTGPYLNVAQQAYASSGVITWTTSGGGNANQIYNGALCGDLTGGVAGTASANVVGGAIDTIDVLTGGSGYLIPPVVTITEVGGSGAKAHAVLTGDAVTSIVVDAGGTGYAAPVVTLSIPIMLLEVYPFNPSVRMSLPTDAVQLALELIESAG
jgi:hypothetical protein